MSQHSESQPAPVSSVATAASAGSLAALVVLGALVALWSLLQWAELLVARSGGTPFCPLGEAGQCTALWDAPFARAVHAYSGVPVAGWGLAWGLAAFVLPLLVLKRRAEGVTAAALTTSVRVTAAAGVVAVFVLGGVAAGAGVFCGSCFATYILVAGYAGVALFSWQHLGLPELPRATVLAGTAALVSLLLLVYPGRRTPKDLAAAGRAAIASSSSANKAAGSGEASKNDAALGEVLASLSPELKQALSDALHQYRTGIAFPPGPARGLIGSPVAPIRITEFTDVLCEHCAQLHETLDQLRQYAPAGSFSIEAKPFPLDAACNPSVQRSGNPERCLAAKAQICFEDHEKAFEFQAALFAKQKTLTAKDVLSIAERFQPRATLQACIDSSATQAKLQADITQALRYDLDGTPLVLLNGRKAASFAPFLFAMILTAGNADHPALLALPKANPNAHIH